MTTMTSRMPLGSSRLRRWVPFVLLAIALAGFPLIASTTAVNLGVYALIYGMAAIGLTLLMGLAGQVSLGHAAFFAVGGYTQAILVTKADWPLAPAAVVSVVASMLVALLVGLPLLRLRGHFLALATLGLGIIVAVVVRELDITGGTSGLYGIPKPEFGGRLYDSAQEYFWLLSPFVLVGLLLATNLVRSRAGRALGAVNDSGGRGRVPRCRHLHATAARLRPRSRLRRCGGRLLCALARGRLSGGGRVRALRRDAPHGRPGRARLRVGCAQWRGRRPAHRRAGARPHHAPHPRRRRRGAADRLRSRARPAHHPGAVLAQLWRSIVAGPRCAEPMQGCRTRHLRPVPTSRRSSPTSSCRPAARGSSRCAT